MIKFITLLSSLVQPINSHQMIQKNNYFLNSPKYSYKQNFEQKSKEVSQKYEYERYNEPKFPIFSQIFENFLESYWTKKENGPVFQNIPRKESTIYKDWKKYFTSFLMEIQNESIENDIDLNEKLLYKEKFSPQSSSISKEYPYQFKGFKAIKDSIDKLNYDFKKNLIKKWNKKLPFLMLLLKNDWNKLNKNRENIFNKYKKMTKFLIKNKYKNKDLNPKKLDQLEEYLLMNELSPLYESIDFDKLVSKSYDRDWMKQLFNIWKNVNKEKYNNFYDKYKEIFKEYDKILYKHPSLNLDNLDVQDSINSIAKNSKVISKIGYNIEKMNKIQKALTISGAAGSILIGSFTFALAIKLKYIKASKKIIYFSSFASLFLFLAGIGMILVIFI